MKKNDNDLNLLPHYFKKIGFAILGLVGVTIASILIFHIPVDKVWTKTITQTGILLSLLIIAISKNKVEDELTLLLRLKALSGSFIAIIVIVIIDPYLNYIFQGEIGKGIIDFRIIITMFIMYFLFYYIAKFGR